VGLNNGRSLQAWPSEVIRSKGIPASGSNVYGRLASCLRGPPTARCWYGFEANPTFNELLSALEARLRHSGERVRLFNGTAFGMDSQPVILYRDWQSHGLSSTLAGNNTLISLRGHQVKLDFSRTVSDRWVQSQVPAIGAGTVLEAWCAPPRPALIAVKIDIEGFEYTLLHHLLKTKPEALCSIDLLAVEWHERIFPMYKGQTLNLTEHLRATCFKLKLPGPVVLGWK
jgi:hypothetical protein